MFQTSIGLERFNRGGTIERYYLLDPTFAKREDESDAHESFDEV